MKLSIAEFENAIRALNTCLQKKQGKLELLEKAINTFIEEEALQGKSYKSAKNYFRDMYLPVVRGMILAYGEIQTANTNCLNDLYYQVSSDSTMKIDTEDLSYCIEEAKRTLNQLEDLEQNSPFVQMQRANLKKLENEITKVTYFNLNHTNHYDAAQSYMSAVKSALSGLQHRSFDPKTKTYKYTVKNKVASQKINKHWLKYQYDQMIKDCIMEDGKIDFKKLNSDFWNRNDGYFGGHWWQDPDKIATAAYVLKLEAEAYGELDIVDMISQYQEGEANPRLNTLQALANAPRVSNYDISLIDAITGNLYASGINYDETKGTINVEDIEAMAEREKNIKFRELGNWLENGGGMLVDGVMIIAGAAIVTSMLNSTSEPISKPTTEPNVTSTRKYKIGQSPKIKSSIFTKNKANLVSSIVTEEMEIKILNGQRVGSSNRVKGGHSPSINNKNPLYAVEKITQNSDGTKVVKYTTQFPDGNISKIKKSTIFSDTWSEDSIINSIKEVGDTSSIATRTSDGATLHRAIINGVEVEVIKIGNTITSGYPTGGISKNIPSGFRAD